MKLRLWFPFAAAIMSIAVIFTFRTPLPLAAQAYKIPFNDPAHKPFFNYQIYLIRHSLHGESESTWNTKSQEQRAKTIQETEEVLEKTLKEVIANPSLLQDKKYEEMIRAVWGNEVILQLKKLKTAYAVKDPQQIVRVAGEMEKGIAKLTQKLAGTPLHSIFDGAIKKGGELAGIEEEAASDHLKSKEPEPNFLAALKSEKVQKVLAGQKQFEEFLKGRDVPEKASQGLSAVYQILNKANPSEKKEVDHILPTIVQFLMDNKKIMNESDDKGAKPDGPHFAYAVSDNYDRPRKLAFADEMENLDPVLIGDTLSHEFQHVYDMYVGRYTTLDTEMRGFKIEALYFRILKREAPKKYAELENSRDDTTSRYMDDVRDYTNAFDAGTEKFAGEIRTGHGYTRRIVGVVHGNVSLREALGHPIEDQQSGLEKMLGDLKWQRDQAKKQVESMSLRREEIIKKLETNHSLALEESLQQTTMKLAKAQSEYLYNDNKATIETLRLNRMRFNLEWLNKTMGPQEPYDLSLQVDENYYKP